MQERSELEREGAPSCPLFQAAALHGGTLRYPITPDRRYFVVRGRLWRCLNPALSAVERHHWTAALMLARRAKGIAMRSGDLEARKRARQQIDEAKIALGERGEPWWTDGAPDWNRHMARNTPYAEWFNALAAG